MHLKLVCQPPLNTKEEEEEKYYSIRTGNTICTAHARNCFHFLSPPTFLRQSSDMDSFAFYVQVQEFLLKGEIPDNSANRRKVRRASTNFIIKDDRLFYVGPSRQYIRLVVLSEEEKRSVLTECHNNPGTGNHSGVRGTQNRVIAGYYWSTIIQDVKEWVRSCHRCQLNDPIKTVVPVLHSIKVKEPWEVLGLDLIGPLPETAHNNKVFLNSVQGIPVASTC
uniref:Gypsy retrotransposon integrase-like protein 1 n=1 Tax=Sinocyclocheilus anshuiensis TaxID=1608454 RepID=A0A671PKI2_9TELE